ncbi:GNS1/SUR4 family-domain-containing protein [Dichotomocladium elegans]|nr:GNS1/SUR4 family-domain-containing protein [Dichotomocladium elegans]
MKTAASSSIDRPFFGVYLYDYFDKLYTAIVGESAANFSFTPGKTPLSTTPEVIFGGQWLLKDASRPINPKFVFRMHNLLLTIVSAALLALLLEQIVPQLVRHGLTYTICSPYGWTQKHEVLYYLNYLVKWWELLDTVFLVLKKKKLEFLHYFHHSMTMVLCYTQLVGRTTSWVPITLNLTVHVFMYYYYYRTASGARIWWKKYLTSLQIIQFVIDLCVIYSCTYTFYVTKRGLNLPNFGSCAGREEAAWFGCALLTSYLLLFINFYRMTYRRQGPAVASAITDGTTPAAYQSPLEPTMPPAKPTTATAPPTRRTQPARRSKKI